MKFLEKRVALSVREILYKEVTEQYFSERNIPFYRVGTSDPPARLTADLETYSKEVCPGRKLSTPWYLLTLGPADHPPSGVLSQARD